MLSYSVRLIDVHSGFDLGVDVTQRPTLDALGQMPNLDLKIWVRIIELGQSYAHKVWCNAKPWFEPVNYYIQGTISEC